MGDNGYPIQDGSSKNLITDNTNSYNTVSLVVAEADTDPQSTNRLHNIGLKLRL